MLSPTRHLLANVGRIRPANRSEAFARSCFPHTTCNTTTHTTCNTTTHITTHIATIATMCIRASSPRRRNLAGSQMRAIAAQKCGNRVWQAALIVAYPLSWRSNKVAGARTIAGDNSTYRVRSVLYALRVWSTVHEVLMRTTLLLAALLTGGGAAAGEADDALAAITAVKREGAGNEAAAARWKEVVGRGPKALPAIFAACDGADATVGNWLRTAAEAITENEQKAGRTLSIEPLETFVRDTKRSARGRELAFELLMQADPAARRRLLPAMLDDPSAGLRRDAVALALDEAKSPEKLRPLFASARDVDQVEKIAKDLAAAGDKPDVVGHLGLITRWQVAGPFDNSKLKGYAAPLPEKLNLIDFATAQERGVVDLYQALGKKRGLDPMTKKKDAVYAIALTRIESPTERPVQIRAATPNAVRIWLNGKEVFSRDEYHHGQRLDQHIGTGTLRKGFNEIIIKVCQDDATPDWTLTWAFQLRVCDEIGGAVPMTVLTAPNAIPVKPEPPKKEPAK
jgi:hypothetical protein